MGRRVRAVVTVGEQILGAVPVFEVASPWWPDVEPVTAHLDALLGTPTTVLRMVRVVGGENPRGGEVTYHVEVPAPPAFAFEPVGWFTRRAVLREHPLRARWARPGGVADIVAWAGQAVDVRGPVTQVKTWNLSCLLRLPTGDGPVWAKSTREFESSEAAAMALVRSHDATLVPDVLSARDGDMLMAGLPGEDAWDADDATVGEAVRRWVAVQAALASTPLDGVPDLRPETLPGRVAHALDGVAAQQLTPSEVAGVRALEAELPARIAALADTGLPDTLVHGDFHSGNWRRGDGTLGIVDWSDAHRGHPAEDLLGLQARLPRALAEVAARAWCEHWSALCPGSEPERALEIMRPLAHLDAASTYQRFLDHIEPDEWPYHRDDPATQLRLALALPAHG